MTTTADWTPGPLQDRAEHIGVLLARWNGTSDPLFASGAHQEIDVALRELRVLRRQIDTEVRAELARADS